MKMDKHAKQSQYISAKRKFLEEQYRRVFERQDFNIERLASHAQQVKYLNGKFDSKERAISDLQIKLTTTRGTKRDNIDEKDRIERQYMAHMKDFDTANFKVEKLQKRLHQLEEQSAHANRLQLDNMQLKIEVKKFQDNLKEVVEKYEGEWQRTKHTEVQNQILKNDQLESIKKLEAQLDKSREKLELVQREHLSNIKIQQQTETVLRAEVRMLNERIEANHTMISNSNRDVDKLKKTLEEERLAHNHHLDQNKILQEQCRELRLRLESIEHFTEKVESELKRQIQLKDQDLMILKNDNHKALTEISGLLIELERARRTEKHLSDKIHYSGQALIAQKRDFSPQTHYWSRQQKRQELPQYRSNPNCMEGNPKLFSYGHESVYYQATGKASPKASVFRANSEESRKFLDIVKRSKDIELRSTEAKVVDRILEKARFIT